MRCAREQKKEEIQQRRKKEEKGGGERKREGVWGGRGGEGRGARAGEYLVCI